MLTAGYAGRNGDGIMSIDHQLNEAKRIHDQQGSMWKNKVKRLQEERNGLQSRIVTLKAKAELFDGLVADCRNMYANGNSVHDLMVAIDNYSDKAKEL